MNGEVCRQRYQEQPGYAYQANPVPVRYLADYHGHQDQNQRKHETQSRPRRFRVPRLAQAPGFPQQQSQILGRAFERVHLAHAGLTSHPGPPPASGLTHLTYRPLTWSGIGARYVRGPRGPSSHRGVKNREAC